MWSKAFLLAFLGFAQISAQLLDPDQVRVLWSAQIEEKNLANSQGVGRGNCAILSPNQKYLITTSIRGTVTAYDALKGDKKWDYDPTVDGGTILRSHSCVVFPPNAVDPYMVYSVVQNENSVNAAT
jgi:glucose dehydrogenase